MRPEERAYFRGTGDAVVISRASPLSAIWVHCQPTVSRKGTVTLAVVQRMLTSCPSFITCDALSCRHAQTRPPVSVTLREAMVLSRPTCMRLLAFV